MTVFSFSRLLVPYDGTESSKIAFQAALKLAKNNQSAILILTCIEEKSTFGFFQTKSDKKEFERIKGEAQRHHARLKKEAEKHEISLRSKIMKSSLASDCIVQHAKENKISLIIISKSRLQTNLEKKYYDSTVENVLKKSSCSVLVVK